MHRVDCKPNYTRRFLLQICRSVAMFSLFFIYILN